MWCKKNLPFAQGHVGAERQKLENIFCVFSWVVFTHRAIHLFAFTHNRYSYGNGRKLQADEKRMKSLKALHQTQCGPW